MRGFCRPDACARPELSPRVGGESGWREWAVARVLSFWLHPTLSLLMAMERGSARRVAVAPPAQWQSPDALDVVRRRPQAGRAPAAAARRRLVGGQLDGGPPAVDGVAGRAAGPWLLQRGGVLEVVGAGHGCHSLRLQQ